MRNRAQLPAVVGAVVLAFVMLQQVISLLGYLSGIPADQLAVMLGSIGGVILTHYLPFAIAVFASLWLVTPITGELSLSSVAKRALLAAGIGAALVFVIRTVLGSAGAFSSVGSFVGNSFPALPVDRVVQEAGFALQAGANIFLQFAPLVMLVVILLWMRLARHPSQHGVSADSGSV